MDTGILGAGGTKGGGTAGGAGGAKGECTLGGAKGDGGGAYTRPGGLARDTSDAVSEIATKVKPPPAVSADRVCGRIKFSRCLFQSGAQILTPTCNQFADQAPDPSRSSSLRLDPCTRRSQSPPPANPPEEEARRAAAARMQTGLSRPGGYFLTHMPT